jgi:hypothetical protein
MKKYQTEFKLKGVKSFLVGSVDQFGLVQPIDRLGQSVVVAVATTAYRKLYPSLNEAFGVENVSVLRAPVGMMYQGIRAFGPPIKKT